MKTSSMDLESTSNGNFPVRTKKAQSTKQRILDVATKLFLDYGFSQTSLDKVAEVAETTKPTVYSHFKSKQGLFDAVVKQHAQALGEGFEKLLQPTDDPAKDLIAFGDVFLPFALSKKTRQWDCLAIAERTNNPEVGEAFFQAGPTKMITALTDYMKIQARENRLAIPNAGRAAEQLIGLMVGVDVIRTLFGKTAPSKAEQKKRCRSAVKVFMAAYQSGGG